MKHKLIISVIYILLALIAFIFAFNTSVVGVLDSSNSYMIPANDFTPSYVQHKLSDHEEGKQEYTAKFELSALKHISGDTYTLIINKITDQAISVRVNGIELIQKGEMQTARSNLKNSLVYCVVDRALLKEINTLRVETHALYKSGIESQGVYFMSTALGNKIVSHLQFFISSSVIFSLGFMLVSAVFIVLIYFMSKIKQVSFIYCALAAIFFGIYFLDYVEFLVLPFDYLLGKKITMTSLYIASTFYIMALSDMLKVKALRYPIFATTAGFIIVTLISRSAVAFKQFYDIWYIFFLIDIFIAFVFILFNIRRNKYAYLFLIGFAAIFVFSFLAILFNLLELPFGINSPIVYIIVMAAFPLLLGIDSILFVENEIAKEQALREIESSKAITDALTGLYNRRFILDKLILIVQSYDPRYYPFTLAMIDIDYFKKINDEHGHVAGDEVLIALAESFMENTRNTDYAGRYGGEEFLIIFTQTDKATANTILERIAAKFKQRMIEQLNIPVSFSGGVITVAVKDKYVDIKDMIHDVDMLLYKAKNAGRNRIETD